MFATSYNSWDKSVGTVYTINLLKREVSNTVTYLHIPFSVLKDFVEGQIETCALIMYRKKITVHCNSYNRGIFVPG